MLVKPLPDLAGAERWLAPRFEQGGQVGQVEVIEEFMVQGILLHLKSLRPWPILAFEISQTLKVSLTDSRDSLQDSPARRDEGSRERPLGSITCQKMPSPARTV